MSDKLDKLRQERDKAERHLRKAANDEKALTHEMARLTRAERTHRLCTRCLLYTSDAADEMRTV